MYNTKTVGRFQELLDGGFNDSDNVEYKVDRDGCMIRVERPRYQVQAARNSVENKTKQQ